MNKPTVTINKEDNLVSIKIHEPNKNPNVVKAVAHLGGYAENKGLLNEVVKTLDWLDSFNNEKMGVNDETNN
tara:strand:+ start:1154 stop:1369 length:216 start_codon:yes stop_codon:yes gene_type:complete